MNCKWCDKKLNDTQVYEYLIGKSKGSACSKKCSMFILHYQNKENYIKKYTFICSICNNSFFRKCYNNSKNKICSSACKSKLSSNIISNNNPMKNDIIRKKVSDTLKKINHKPFIQGGNGRGATINQLNFYNELIKIDNSFQLEYIIKTGHLRKIFNSPNHYKLDIASEIHKLCIEIDGNSHKCLKVSECDQRKTKLLNLKGWKVLRLSNFQIQNELQNCVQMVMSMI